MPYLMIGAGQAGGALVDSIFKHKNMNLIASPIAINSTVKDLHHLKNIDRNNWYGISEKSGLINGNTAGFEEQVVGGFGKNPVRANDVVEEQYQSIIDLFEKRFSTEGGVSSIPFAFIFLGLGGGTGCGASPYIVRALKEVNPTIKIIAIVVLPAIRRNIVADESDTSDRQAWNAIYGLNRLKGLVESFIVIDNQRISHVSNIESMYPEYNEYIATSIVDLIAGLILEKIDPSRFKDLNPPVIDLNDIITATSFDHKGRSREPGFAAIGRSAFLARDLIGYLFPFLGYKKIDGLTLAKLVMRKQTIADVSINACEKNLALIKIPSAYLEKGGHGIDTKLIEEYMVKNSRLNECHIGVSLTKKNLVSLTGLFTYSDENLYRLKELRDLAKRYEDKSKDLITTI